MLAIIQISYSAIVAVICCPRSTLTASTCSASSPSCHYCTAHLPLCTWRAASGQQHGRLPAQQWVTWPSTSCWHGVVFSTTFTTRCVTGLVANGNSSLVYGTTVLSWLSCGSCSCLAPQPCCFYGCRPLTWCSTRASPQ